MMNEGQEKIKENERIPDGFIHIRLDQLLWIVAFVTAIAAAIAEKGTQYHLWIVTPFIFILLIASVVARRGVRKYVKKYGKVELIFTFEWDNQKPKRSILFRNTGELIDEAIDRILDGKEDKK